MGYLDELNRRIIAYRQSKMNPSSQTTPEVPVAADQSSPQPAPTNNQSGSLFDRISKRMSDFGSQDSPDVKSPKDSSDDLSQIAAAKLKTLGETQASKITQSLAEKTGLKPEEVVQALPGVQSALRGAQVVQAQGEDPSKLGLAGLKALDPANPGNGYPDYNKNLSQEHMIAGALTTLLPSLLSYAIAGPEGGKIAADASGKTAENFINNITTQRKLEQHQFERNQDIDYRNRALKVQEKGVLGKKNYQERALTLQEQIAGNRNNNEKTKLGIEQQKIDKLSQNPIKPTKLSPAQLDQVSGFNTAYNMMDDLEKKVDEHQNSFGRKNHLKDVLDPEKQNDAKLNAVDTELEKVGRQIGMAVKGSSLTQEEGNYWGNQFTRWDTAQGVKDKVAVFRKMMKQKEKAFYDAASMNNQPMPGYTPKLDQLESFPGVDESAIKEQMEKNDLTRDQVIQLLKKRAEKNGK